MIAKDETFTVSITHISSEFDHCPSLAGESEEMFESDENSHRGECAGN